MSLIARGGKHFTPAPEGLFPAVCVDVVDLGMVESPWGEKHKCRLTWEISELMDDGRRFIVSKQYTVSLHEKSSLHKDLKAWRGRAFTPEELEGFDLENVIGAPCQLLIQHTEKEGTTYANVGSILKADGKKRLQPTGDYVRVKDRKDKPLTESGESEPGSDDDIPF